MKKTFNLETVLTVTTDRLLTEMDSLYSILGWMTNDKPYTSQIPRFMDECKPWLIRWFPELGKVDVLELDEKIKTLGGKDGCRQWVAGLDLPKNYEIGKIPADDHVVKNAYDELVEQRGTDEGIVVVDHE